MVVTPWVVRPLARPAAPGWRFHGRTHAFVATAMLLAVATVIGLAWANGILRG